MWPDTWSGQQKIHFYSLTGCTRTWTLPREWARIRQGRLFRLSAAGRDSGVVVSIADRRAHIALEAGVPAVLEPADL